MGNAGLRGLHIEEGSDRSGKWSALWCTTPAPAAVARKELVDLGGKVKRRQYERSACRQTFLFHGAEKKPRAAEAARGQEW